MPMWGMYWITPEPMLTGSATCRMPIHSLPWTRATRHILPYGDLQFLPVPICRLEVLAQTQTLPVLTWVFRCNKSPRTPPRLFPTRQFSHCTDPPPLTLKGVLLRSAPTESVKWQETEPARGASKYTHS